MSPILLLAVAASCSQLIDLPEPEVSFEARALAPLRTTHHLLQRFSEGEGKLVAAKAASPLELEEGLSLHSLPWYVDPDRLEHVKLLAWGEGTRRNDENFAAIVLRSGESWCTALDGPTPEGARLRFEAFSIERDRPGVVRVGAHSQTASYPESLSADRQSELELEGDRVCFEASGGAVAIGEPRILVPEGGDDRRPRWLILTIVDALRGSVLRDDEGKLPAMRRLSDEGVHYVNATSPGCHTRASVLPILTGRDLMRVDPLKRRQSMPVESPLETTYARSNLFVTHLAESAGYHSVFLGNNAYLRLLPAFSRYSSWGDTGSGTIDTMEKLPHLFRRYADERVLLVFYVSTPHAQSQTPRRLYDALACGGREGLAECRCAYDARVRHADEALAALERGIREHGLEDQTVQILTADHGELFGEGMKIEGEVLTFAEGIRGGAFRPFDRNHGNACHSLETDVPIVVHSKDVHADRRREPVSGLDIVPTLMKLMKVPIVSKLDGSVLPAFATGTPPPERPLVSYGFCSDSRKEADRQLIWWVEGCRLREVDGRAPVSRQAELWVNGELSTGAAGELEAMMRRHESWLVERLPAESFVFGLANLPEAEVEVSVEAARIVDYGPAATVSGLEKIESAELSGDGSRLTVRFRGYRGLFQVSTNPPRAPVRIHVRGREGVVAFAGPHQLPLQIAESAIDPARDSWLLASETIPVLRPTTVPALRFWWQTHRSANAAETATALSDFDRVLREWGYVR
ncbi:MAG TPA: sulfatase-like hydrolase/transferase [Vicinamibacteria bacterium]|nr:sulfatase-like hydrolase/transferase [Vicinamibacteria bacterium]